MTTKFEYDNSPEMLVTEGLGWDKETAMLWPTTTAALIKALAKALDAELEKTKKVRAYAQDRVIYGKRGVVNSSRIASDLNQIVGGVKL